MSLTYFFRFYTDSFHFTNINFFLLQICPFLRILSRMKKNFDYHADKNQPFTVSKYGARKKLSGRKQGGGDTAFLCLE